MRMLFDTNVLVAAFIKGGSSYDVIEHAVHEHEVYYTLFIISEFRNVFKTKFHYPESAIKEFVLFIRRFFIKGDTAKIIDDVCRDPEDDQVLADALSNGIDVIISGDKDLLILKKYKGIRIILPRDYWSL